MPRKCAIRCVFAHADLQDALHLLVTTDFAHPDGRIFCPKNSASRPRWDAAVSVSGNRNACRTSTPRGMLSGAQTRLRPVAWRCWRAVCRCVFCLPLLDQGNAKVAVHAAGALAVRERGRCARARVRLQAKGHGVVESGKPRWCVRVVGVTSVTSVAAPGLIQRNGWGERAPLWWCPRRFARHKHGRCFQRLLPPPTGGRQRRCYGGKSLAQCCSQPTRGRGCRSADGTLACLRCRVAQPVTTSHPCRGCLRKKRAACA